MRSANIRRMEGNSIGAGVGAALCGCPNRADVCAGKLHPRQSCGFILNQRTQISQFIRKLYEDVAPSGQYLHKSQQADYTGILPISLRPFAHRITLLPTMYKIPQLPFDFDLESRVVLKKTAAARSALAEMKGAALSIPNESILINTLSLQEAKDSSAIENIITTHDELFQSDVLAQNFKTLASKEVHNYAGALRWGFQTVREQGFLSNNHIIAIQEAIEGNRAGFRQVSGTALKNEQTGEVVYTPPQSHDEIVACMANLEQFMNVNELCDWDPLVKMAVIHHQFESIHPFYDGNGRTGRIVNILYLVKEGLLNLPILYLSRYINQNKSEYYHLLQKVRTAHAWEEWVLYMLEGVEQTSTQTIKVIDSMKQLMQRHKKKIREKTKFYSQDLINNLFKHPYTKIDFIMADLDVSRITATKYLDELDQIGVLQKVKLGRDSYYINTDLYHLLSNVSRTKHA